MDLSRHSPDRQAGVMTIHRSFNSNSFKRPSLLAFEDFPGPVQPGQLLLFSFSA
jgi:hypothetical protein